MTHAERKAALEAKFASVFTEKARHDEASKRLHDELMRIQGQVALLSELPDSPAPVPPAKRR